MSCGFREPVDASPGPESSAMSLDKQPEGIAARARGSIPRILSCMLALCYRLEMYLRLGRPLNEGKDSLLWPCQKVCNAKDV